MAKKAKDREVRWVVGFRCLHCDSERVFLQAGCAGEIEAVARSREEAGLTDVWVHVWTGKLVD